MGNDKYYIGKSKITWRCSMKCTGELYTYLKKENPKVKTGHSLMATLTAP
ncbi:hypothetical protein QTP88_014261 [Uroleucon formosanum]